jgi:hypothetical protein
MSTTIQGAGTTTTMTIRMKIIPVVGQVIAVREATTVALAAEMKRTRNIRLMLFARLSITALITGIIGTFQ